MVDLLFWYNKFLIVFKCFLNLFFEKFISFFGFIGWYGSVLEFYLGRVNFLIFGLLVIGVIIKFDGWLVRFEMVFWFLLFLFFCILSIKEEFDFWILFWVFLFCFNLLKFFLLNVWFRFNSVDLLFFGLVDVIFELFIVCFDVLFELEVFLYWSFDLVCFIIVCVFFKDLCFLLFDSEFVVCGLLLKVYVFCRIIWFGRFNRLLFEMIFFLFLLISLLGKSLFDFFGCDFFWFLVIVVLLFFLLDFSWRFSLLF